jgi:hypothetical protein
MTRSHKIGYIASFPIPEVIRDINAIQLALDKYDPQAELKVMWVSTWFDPGKEADAANALIDQGVDVVFQHADPGRRASRGVRRGLRLGHAALRSEDRAHLDRQRLGPALYPLGPGGDGRHLEIRGLLGWPGREYGGPAAEPGGAAGAGAGSRSAAEPSTPSPGRSATSPARSVSPPASARPMPTWRR